jgi:acyl dehydratase
MIEIADPEELRGSLGTEIAVSDWLEVTQERVNQFADATDDHQWIHVDVQRAAESAFTGTIAHGFLTLSLISTLLRNALRVSGLRMAINYGVNKVRFVSIVPVGSRIRGRFAPVAVEPTAEGFQVIWKATIERERGDKPCCVAEWIIRYYR